MVAAWATPNVPRHTVHSHAPVIEPLLAIVGGVSPAWSTRDHAYSLDAASSVTGHDAPGSGVHPAGIVIVSALPETCPTRTATSPAAQPDGSEVAKLVLVAEPLLPEVTPTYETATANPSSADLEDAR
ncbi:hypothetical protein OOK41_09065 [Micromonospora sp. NBC_01655]|uniref:hypothetical protein n=1 Tax=Micromonospora sp. NBC_01655 TaxID=2975983 RepID=UPI00225B59A4|nr:hypothetical protein [Micromonospora sp. NBC_01655]MCX4470455.1 hypothetical protein [Micromonospora sp. NBC_01655]